MKFNEHLINSLFVLFLCFAALIFIWELMLLGCMQSFSDYVLCTENDLSKLMLWFFGLFK